MMRRSWIPCVMVMMSTMTACSEPITGTRLVETPDGRILPQEDVDPLFRTDSSSYVLRATDIGWQVRIGATFTNRTNGTAFIVNCQGGTNVQLEKLVSNGWVSVWTPFLLACLSAPIRIPVGGAYQSSVFVFGGYPDNNYAPKFPITDLDGVYRLKWTQILSSYDSEALKFGNPLPDEWRVSNRFRLVAERRP